MLWFISEFSSLAAGLSCSLDHLPGPPMPADGTLGLLCLAEKWLMNLSVAGTCARSSEPSVQQEARVTHQMSSAYRKDISIIFTVFNCSTASVLLTGVSMWTWLSCFTSLPQFEYPYDFLFFSFTKACSDSFSPVLLVWRTSPEGTCRCTFYTWC